MKRIAFMQLVIVDQVRPEITLSHPDGNDTHGQDMIA